MKTASPWPLRGHPPDIPPGRRVGRDGPAQVALPNQRYEQRYGSTPTQWAVQLYDSIRMVADTAVRIGSTDPTVIAQPSRLLFTGSIPLWGNTIPEISTLRLTGTVNTITTPARAGDTVAGITNADQYTNESEIRTYVPVGTAQSISKGMQVRVRPQYTALQFCPFHFVSPGPPPFPQWPAFQPNSHSQSVCSAMTTSIEHRVLTSSVSPGQRVLCRRMPHDGP